MTVAPAVWLIGRTWTTHGPGYVARRAVVVLVLLLLAGLTGALTVGFARGLVSGSGSGPGSVAWRVGVVAVYLALFALGVMWTARRCLAVRRAAVADLRTAGRGRRGAGAGSGVGVLAATGTALAVLVVVVSAAAVFGGVLTLLVFSLDRYAIGEPGARREAGYPV